MGDGSALLEEFTAFMSNFPNRRRRLDGDRLPCTRSRLVTKAHALIEGRKNTDDTGQLIGDTSVI